MGRDVRTLTEADLTAVRALLMDHASTSLFMLGNLEQAGLSYQGQRYQGEFFGAFVQDRLIAIVVQYWNGIVHAQGDAASVSDIWLQICQRLRPVKGFVGREDLCQRLKAHWDQQSPQTVWQMTSRERLYELQLSQMTPPSLLGQPDIDCRLMTADDRPLMETWMLGYNQEALSAQAGPELAAEVRDSVAAKLEAGATYLLTAQGVPVATCSFNAMSKPFVQIGGVWTPVALRSRGYARAVVAAALMHAQSIGYRVSILFTDPELVPAHKAYESLGYQHIGEFGLYLAE